MENKNLGGVIVGVLIIVLLVGGILWYQNSGTDTVESQSSATTGKVYVGITDATADINNVNEINMEVKKAEIYSSARGWVTISGDSKKYDLLKLKAEGRTEFYGSADVDAGAYDRVRLTLGNTVVKTKSNGDVVAYLPGKQVVMNMDVMVEAGQDTSVELDVLADKSLHTTSDNKFVFAPVVRAQSQSGADVSISNQNAITYAGGTMDSTANVGVNIDGTSRSDFTLTTANDLKVDASNTGSIKFMLGGKTYTENKELQEVPLDAKVEGSSSLDAKLDAGVNLGL